MLNPLFQEYIMIKTCKLKIAEPELPDFAKIGINYHNILY